MSGYCDTGRLLTVINPINTIIMAMTVAKIGRSMKNLENISVRLGRFGTQVVIILQLQALLSCRQ